MDYMNQNLWFIQTTRKCIVFLLLLSSQISKLEAQQEIIDSNIALLNSLETKYKTPCVAHKHKEEKRKAIKIDKGIIYDLNNIYSSRLDFRAMIQFLNKLGYKESSRINLQKSVLDTVYYRKISEGQLDGYIQLVYNTEDNKLHAKKILLATKTHFICETKEWQSYSYIDFYYLRKFVKEISFPLQVAWSNVELESK